jgi:hypothetical protein
MKNKKRIFLFLSLFLLVSCLDVFASDGQTLKGIYGNIGSNLRLFTKTIMFIGYAGGIALVVSSFARFVKSRQQQGQGGNIYINQLVAGILLLSFTSILNVGIATIYGKDGDSISASSGSNQGLKDFEQSNY